MSLRIDGADALVVICGKLAFCDATVDHEYCCVGELGTTWAVKAPCGPVKATFSGWSNNAITSCSECSSLDGVWELPKSTDPGATGKCHWLESFVDAFDCNGDGASLFGVTMDFWVKACSYDSGGGVMRVKLFLHLQHALILPGNTQYVHYQLDLDDRPADDGCQEYDLSNLSETLVKSGGNDPCGDAHSPAQSDGNFCDAPLTVLVEKSV